MRKRLWHVGGWIAMILGLVGIVLPVMPTVPFLLVAVWCFSRSSPALRARILDNPRYGPMMRDWTDRGAIPLRAKLWALAAMTGGVLMTLWLTLPIWLVLGQAAICVAVAVFVVTRPST